MSVKDLLVLTILMSWGTHNLIEAEVIRGIDIPRLNTSRLVGQWYMLTKYSADAPVACSSNIMTRVSDDSYTLNVTQVFTPEALQENPNLIETASNPFITVTLQKDSNILLSINDRGYKWSLVMFDVDYDSHMAGYIAETQEDIKSGNNGKIFVLGRKKNLPDDVLERVKQTDFYKHGLEPKFELLRADNNDC